MKHRSHDQERDQQYAARFSQMSHYSYVRSPAADVTHVASHYKELAINMYKRFLPLHRAYCYIHFTKKQIMNLFQNTLSHSH
jgi:hypothetical protein